MLINMLVSETLFCLKCIQTHVINELTVTKVIHSIEFIYNITYDGRQAHLHTFS